MAVPARRHYIHRRLKRRATGVSGTKRRAQQRGVTRRRRRGGMR